MFRNNKPHPHVNVHVTSVYVTEFVPIEESDNGILKRRVVEKEVDVLDPEQMPDLPNSRELTFENLRDSGYPMQQMPVAGMLNPTDPDTLGTLSQNGLLNLVARTEEPAEVPVEVPSPTAQTPPPTPTPNE